MQQFFGKSKSGNLSEAVSGLKNPKFIMLFSNNSQFEAHVQALEKLYPKVPSIGCIGMGYSTEVIENGVCVVAFCGGITATANVLEQVSVMPVKYIHRLEEDLLKINASHQDTVCIDFCTGNDALVLTTINTALKRNNVSLIDRKSVV